MAYTLEIEPDGPVLRVRVSGTVDNETVPTHEADIQRITSVCKANGCSGILLDVGDAALDLRSSAKVKALLGFARLAPRGVRLASLGVAGRLAPGVLAEILAAARGLAYRGFDDEAEAVAWLSAGG